MPPRPDERGSLSQSRPVVSFIHSHCVQVWVSAKNAFVTGHNQWTCWSCIRWGARLVQKANINPSGPWPWPSRHEIGAIHLLEHGLTPNGPDLTKIGVRKKKGHLERLASRLKDTQKRGKKSTGINFEPVSCCQSFKPLISGQEKKKRGRRRRKEKSNLLFPVLQQKLLQQRERGKWAQNSEVHQQSFHK